MSNNILICNHEDDVREHEGVVIKYINDIETILELSNYKKDVDVIKVRFDLGSQSSKSHGIEFSMRIRLSNDLSEKIRFAPIIIIDDSLDELSTVKKLLKKDIFNIFSTKGFYFEKNPNKPITLDKTTFKKSFLDVIKVNPPIDRTGNHGVANRWAIKRWSEVLGITEKDAIKKNNEEIGNALYTKYLETVHEIVNQTSKKETYFKPIGSGSVLLIDDESDKGWGDIIKEIASTGNISLTIATGIDDALKEGIPDVVILDLRLEEQDEDENDIDKMISIRTMDALKKANPGIQFIILSATSKSIILDKLHQKGIVGFVKKEHPEDTATKTVDSISRLSELIDVGLKNSYLKAIYNLEKSVIHLPFLKKEDYNQEQKESIAELYSSLFNVAAVLDSNVKKHFTFGMLAIYKLIETINKLYIKEEVEPDSKPKSWKAYWINNDQVIYKKQDNPYKNKGITSTEYKFNCILEKFNCSNKDSRKILEEIKNFRNCEIHPESKKYDHKNYGADMITSAKLKAWFNLVCLVIIEMNKSPQISSKEGFVKQKEENEVKKAVKQIVERSSNVLDKKDHGLRNEAFADFFKNSK